MKKNSFRIQRKRLSDQIIENLIAMIASGELKPGEKLPPEPQLMDQFGVGRSSVREAIGALELIGLITVRPGHGTHIADSPEKAQSKTIGLSLLAIGQDKIRELVEARIELEQIIVRLVTERATEEDIAKIRDMQTKLTKAVKNKQKFIDTDLGFHTALAKASHNRVLVRFLNELRQPIRHWMKPKAKYDREYNLVIEQHETIIKAIEARDSAAAQSAVCKHLELAGEKLIKTI